VIVKIEMAILEVFYRSFLYFIKLNQTGFSISLYLRSDLNPDYQSLSCSAPNNSTSYFTTSLAFHDFASIKFRLPASLSTSALSATLLTAYQPYEVLHHNIHHINSRRRADLAQNPKHTEPRIKPQRVKFQPE
jgi:hypothetical protein